MPGLLAQVSSDVVLAGPEQEPVPDTLLPRLDREVRRAGDAAYLADDGRRRSRGRADHRARRVRADQRLRRRRQPAVRRTVVQPLGHRRAGRRGDDPGRAGRPERNVVITSVDWGTKLELTCSYDPPEHEYGDDPPAWTYALVVRTTDGRVEQVGTWTALPGRTLSFTGGTAALADDIASLEVRAPDGTPVLRLAT